MDTSVDLLHDALERSATGAEALDVPAGATRAVSVTVQVPPFVLSRAELRLRVSISRLNRATLPLRKLERRFRKVDLRLILFEEPQSRAIQPQSDARKLDWNLAEPLPESNLRLSLDKSPQSPAPPGISRTRLTTLKTCATVAP